MHQVIPLETISRPTTLTLPAGTVCKRGGVPFELAADTLVICHPENASLIEEGFKPSVSYGPTCDRNQSLQLAASPPPGPKKPMVSTQEFLDGVLREAMLALRPRTHRGRLRSQVQCATSVGRPRMRGAGLRQVLLRRGAKS